MLSKSATWLLLALFCAGLTLLVYGAALELPFFFDDFVHYPFVQANDLARIWLTTDELAYYRPINFSIWRLTYDLFQRHVPAVDHGINLLLHAVNGFMVGLLADRLWRLRGDRFPTVLVEDSGEDWWRAFLSAALFLLFPFSYQAVPWVGSLSHLTVTTLILLSVFCYVQMRRSHLRPWGLASLFFAFLAPFAHENGVLVMPLLMLVDLTTPYLRGRWQQAVRTGLIWSLPLVIYVPVWLSLPRLDGDGLFGGGLETLTQNAAYFAQGVFYPLTGLGGWLHYQRGLDDMTAVIVLSALALLIAAVIQVTQGATLRSLLPWGWAALASLPAVLFLTFDYVINGPRLLMVAAVGIAWLWADVILLFARGGKRGSAERIMRSALAAVCTVLLLGQNTNFVQERMTMHQVLGDGFKQIVAETAAANAAGRKAVVVNFPSWLAPQDATYALGHEGVLFWPDYVPPGLLTAVHTGQLGALRFVKVDGIRPELPTYYYGLTGPTPEWELITAVPSRIFQTNYRPAEVALEYVGEVGEHTGQLPNTLVTFDDDGSGTAVQLTGARAVADEDGLRVETQWQSDTAPAGATLFVHAMGTDGRLLAQADGDLLGGSYPFAAWTGGGPVLDVRRVPLEAGEAAEIRLGLYDRQSGQRFTATAADGAQISDGAFRLAIDSAE